MTWSSLSFSNLTQVGDPRIVGFTADGDSTAFWTFDGHEDWNPTESIVCDLFTFGVVTGTQECPLADKPPDSDHIARPTTPATAELAHITYTLDGAYNGAYDENCYENGEHVIGLNSGGCRPKEPVYPFLDVRNDRDYQDLIDIDGVATRTAFGTTFEDGFTHAEIGGNWMIVNPSPPTYPGMDPGNAANQTLFEVADLPDDFWLHFRAPDLTPVFVGRTFGQFQVAVRYYKTVVPEDVPVGIISAGDPISGVIRRKVRT